MGNEVSIEITANALRLFQFLQMLDDQLLPDRCKLHLACWNGSDDPLDVYLAGEFEEWQSWQNGKNFEREIVVSMIALPRANLWLFTGAYDSSGSDWIEKRGLHKYRLHKRSGTAELEGRPVIRFQRPGRQSYLLAEKWSEALSVAELRPERMRIAEFPGYSRVMLTKQQLDIVVREQIESWKAALTSVAGVYVIADRKTGKLYVGSATAGDGVWSRWCDYSATGHGANRELRELLEREGKAYADNFQFGILEIADSNASQEDVISRESRWKELLLTREYGYNSN